MSEHIRKLVHNRTARAIGVCVVVGTILAGCGSDIDASTAQSEACQDAAAEDMGFRWNSRIDTTSITSSEGFVAEASGYIKDLQRQALARNGVIDMPEYTTKEISATDDQLELFLPANNYETLSVTNSIVFSFKDGKPVFNISALTCQGDDGLYPTIFFDKLKQYAEVVNSD